MIISLMMQPLHDTADAALRDENLPPDLRVLLFAAHRQRKTMRDFALKQASQQPKDKQP
jgi:hypothetical protein